MTYNCDCYHSGKTCWFCDRSRGHAGNHFLCDHWRGQHVVITYPDYKLARAFGIGCKLGRWLVRYRSSYKFDQLMLNVVFSLAYIVSLLIVQSGEIATWTRAVEFILAIEIVRKSAHWLGFIAGEEMYNDR